MVSWANYHSHTHFCDGAAPPEEYVQEAIKQGLAAYGFSSHASVPFKTDWCIPDLELQNYLSAVKTLKTQYSKQIQIYLGLEIDYIPGIAHHLSGLLKNEVLDYSIHSIHFVDALKDKTPWNIDTSFEIFEEGLHEIFDGNFRHAATRFWELTRQMVRDEQPRVIGHLDKIKMFNVKGNYFRESETWYQNEVAKTLKLIKEAGSIVEINTRGYYRYQQPDLYPGRWITEQLAKLKIPVMINSDSHKPREITEGLAYAAQILLDVGINSVMILYNDHWEPHPITPKGIVL